MQQTGQRFLSDSDQGLLLTGSEDHLRLLHAVDCFPGFGGLYEGPSVDRAISRYQALWLPFVASAKEQGLDLNYLIPPLDIAWAWHVHRLNPVAYEADCQRAVQQVIRPNGRQAFKFSDGKDSQSRYTKKHWKKCFPNHPYFPKEVAVSTSKVASSSMSMSMDLPSAMKCQAFLLRQILQPAIVNKSELKEMIRRYALFLELRKQAPQVFSVPPVDVDFIWHTHMSMNLQYYNMCMAHFGGLVSHKTVSPDDKAASLTRDSGFHDTQKAWAELFPESPYLSPRWDNNMPSKHPLVVFMENISVNLESLYEDGSGSRAGSHALHAMAVLLEMRRKFDSDDSCGYICCVAPGRRTNYGMPSTLANDLGQKYARLPLSSTSKWLQILQMTIPFDGPPQGVTEAIQEAGVEANREKYGRRRPVPTQFGGYRTGPGHFFVVAAIGRGYCGNVGACGGAAGGSCGGFGGGGCSGGGGCGGGGCGGGGG